MYIKSLELENYKCFWKPQKAVLVHGFNLFVGMNNSGKTTMLEALELTNGVNEPHRSYDNLLSFGDQSNGTSRFITELATNFNELRRICGNDFYVPIPDNYNSIDGARGYTANDIAARFLVDSDITLSLVNNGVNHTVVYKSYLGPSKPASRNINGTATDTQGDVLYALRLTYKDGSELVPEALIQNFGGIGRDVVAIRENFQRYIYRFSAQRKPAGECGNQGGHILDRDATNLPYCINHL